MGHKVPILTASVLALLITSSLVLTSGVLTSGVGAAGVGAAGDSFKDKAAAITAEITGMRSVRASKLHPASNVVSSITVESFKQTCGPVAKRVMEISKEQSVKIRHAALKYRNPKNAATPEEAAMMEMFDFDRSVTGKLDRIELEGTVYRRYSAPIFVEPACLKCHGDKDARPGFVLKKYPLDRAWGFGVGDIRGIISVLSPL